MHLGQLLSMEERIVLNGAAVAEVDDSVDDDVVTGAPAIGQPDTAGKAAEASNANSGSHAKNTTGTTAQPNQESTPNNARSGEQTSASDMPDHGAQSELKALLVNTEIENFQELVAGAAKDVLVYTYDGSRDSLKDILDGLREQMDGRLFGSIAFTVEGRGDGVFGLTDGETISWNTLPGEVEADQQEFFTALAGMMKENGRIDLLACDVAGEAKGDQLLQAVATIAEREATEAANVTGIAKLGSDWVLEKNADGDEVDLLSGYFSSDAVNSIDSILAAAPRASGKDLVIDNINYWSSQGSSTQIGYRPGENIGRVSGSYSNIGDQNVLESEDFRISYYLSRDGVLNDESILLTIRRMNSSSDTQDIVNGIAAGESRNFTYNGTDGDGPLIPEDIATGSYYLIVKIDSAENVVEENESNNIWVSSTADILISDNYAPILSTDYSPTLGTQEEYASDPSGTLVADIIPSGSIRDDDGGSITSLAVVEVDNRYGFWQYSTDNGETWNNFSNTADSVVSLNDSARLLDAECKIRFMQTKEVNNWGDSVSFSYRAWDQSMYSVGDVADTTVNGRWLPFSTQFARAALTIVDSNTNTAPVLDTSYTPTLDSQVVGDSSPDGTLVSKIIQSDSIEDPDGVTKGMVVTSVDNRGGYWEYSLDGGTTWLRFTETTGGVVHLDTDPSAGNELLDLGKARLLDGSALIRFDQRTGTTGDVTFTFQAWDMSDGKASGSVGDPTTSGGNTAFSSQFDEAVLTITVGNRAPEIDIDAPLNMGAQDIGVDNPSTSDNEGVLVSEFIRPGVITDADSGNSTDSIIVNGVDNTYGIWQYSTDGGTTWLNFSDQTNGFVNLDYSQGGINDLGNSRLLDGGSKIRFIQTSAIPDSVGGVNITFQAWDGTGGKVAGETADPTNNGGANPFSAGHGSATMFLDQPNRTPAVVDPIGNVDFDGSGEHSVDLSGIFADPDGDSLSYSVSYLVDGDWVALPSWLVFNAGALTISGNPAVANEGVYSLRVTATDRDGLTATDNFTVTVRDANDAPQSSGRITTIANTSSSDQVLGSVQGSDPDGDSFSYFLDGSERDREAFDISSDGKLILKGGTSVGEYEIIVGVRDSNGEETTKTVTITVRETPPTQNVDNAPKNEPILPEDPINDESPTETQRDDDENEDRIHIDREELTAAIEEAEKQRERAEDDRDWQDAYEAINHQHALTEEITGENPLETLVSIFERNPDALTYLYDDISSQEFNDLISGNEYYGLAGWNYGDPTQNIQMVPAEMFSHLPIDVLVGIPGDALNYMFTDQIDAYISALAAYCENNPDFIIPEHLVTFLYYRQSVYKDVLQNTNQAFIDVINNSRTTKSQRDAKILINGGYVNGFQSINDSMTLLHDLYAAGVTVNEILDAVNMANAAITAGLTVKEILDTVNVDGIKAAIGAVFDDARVIDTVLIRALALAPAELLEQGMELGSIFMTAIGDVNAVGTYGESCTQEDFGNLSKGRLSQLQKEKLR